MVYWLLDLCTAREVIRLSWEVVQCSRKGSVRRTGHAGRFYTRLALCWSLSPFPFSYCSASSGVAAPGTKASMSLEVALPKLGTGWTHRTKAS